MTSAAKYEEVRQDVAGDVEMQALEDEGSAFVKVLHVGLQTTKTVRVKDDGDVSSLMSAIEDAFGAEEAPRSRQRLISAGRVLKAEDSLASHKLVEASEETAKIVHLSMRPTESPSTVVDETTLNPLASVDALTAVLAMETPPRLPPEEPRNEPGESAFRAAARVRLLSSLLALYCALNSLTALLDATTLGDDAAVVDDSSSTVPDERAVAELALNIGGLWVGAAGLRASRHLDIPSADRYDRGLRIFALATLSYEAYYRLCYLPARVGGGDDDDDAGQDQADAESTSSSSSSTTNVSSTIGPPASTASPFGDDDRGAGAKGYLDDDASGTGGNTRDSELLSGFVTLMLMAAIWLICVQNSARLRAELRGVATDDHQPAMTPSPFGPTALPPAQG